MNVDDIIRKLQCCGNQMYSCTDKRCKAKTLGDAVELINRQRAEIERLYKSLNLTAQEQYTNGRNDGIKEFAEKLKLFAITKYDWSECVDIEDIEKLAKELTEEQNGNL